MRELAIIALIALIALALALYAYHRLKRPIEHIGRIELALGVLIALLSSTLLERRSSRSSRSSKPSSGSSSSSSFDLGSRDELPKTQDHIEENEHERAKAGVELPLDLDSADDELIEYRSRARQDKLIK